MNDNYYHVSLRFFHPTIEPDEICNRLKFEAEFKWRAGENRKTPKGDRLEGVYETSYCCFEFENTDKSELCSYMENINLKLYKHKEFLHTIRSTGGRIEYDIGWFIYKPAGEVFDLKLLMQLVDLQIDFSISVYPPKTPVGEQDGRIESAGEPAMNWRRPNQ